MNRPQPAPVLLQRPTVAVPFLRRLRRVGVQHHQGVSDKDGARWEPKTPGENLAVWTVAWRWTRCNNPRCRCATNPQHRHGPYLSLRVATGEGERHQVYVPKAATATVLRALRKAKGIRKRRLRRERQQAQQNVQRAREQQGELRRAIAALNAAYGRP